MITQLRGDLTAGAETPSSEGASVSVGSAYDLSLKTTNGTRTAYCYASPY